MYSMNVFFQIFPSTANMNINYYKHSYHSYLFGIYWKKRGDYCDQGDDRSRERVLQCRGRVTASCFNEIVKRQATDAPLVQRIMHKVTRETATIRYSCTVISMSLILDHLCVVIYWNILQCLCENLFSPQMHLGYSGTHQIMYLLYSPQDNWIGALPGGLVVGPVTPVEIDD